MVRKILWTAMLALLPLWLCAQRKTAYEALFQDTPVEEVFRILEKKYPLKFAYDLEALSTVRINQHAKAGSIQDFLDQVFKGTGLVYQMPREGQVLIRRENLPAPVSIPEPVQIYGQVSDALSGAPLAFAHVLFAEDAGVAADEQGHFNCKISLPTSGRATLNVQYIGYQSRTVVVDPRKAGEGIQVRLIPKVEKLPGIVVKEKAPLSINKKSSDGNLLRSAQISTIGNFYGGKDIFRGIQMLPGVDASNDLSSDLSIRSSNGDENLVLLDGMTLYNVTHFFGIFSLVNPNIVNEIKVYKNAFPAEYGGRTAAVIDMQTLPRRDEGGVQGVIDLNLLTSGAALEAPIGPNMSILAGFRTTNGNLGQSSLFEKTNPTTNTDAYPNLPAGRNTATTIQSQQPEFYFNDANLKWTWQPADKTSFQASFFRGRDRFDYTFNRNIYPPFRKPNTFLQEKYQEETRWQNDGASANWSQEWSPGFRSSTTASFSAYENNALISNSFNRVLESNQQPGLQFENKHFNRVEEFNLHQKNTWSLPKGQSLHAGYQGAFSHSRFNIGEDGKSPLNGDHKKPQHSAYLQYLNGSTVKNFSADLGLRATLFNGKTYLSPRLFLSYSLLDDFWLKASFGRYQQFVRQLYHEDRFGRSFQYWVLSENRFPVAISDNLMLGFAHKNPWFDLDVEFYQKNTTGVIEHAQQRVGLPTVDGRPAPFKYTLFQGKGNIRGMDVLIQKSFPKSAFWAAYTLSKSTHSFPQVYQGNPFPSPNDRRHQLKLNAQHNIGSFNFGATYIFASGRPYTNLAFFDSNDGDRNTLSPTERLEYLDDYHRVDLFANCTFPLGKGEGKAGINLFNLFDRENVKYRQFIYSFLTPTNGPGSKPNINTVVGTELEMMGFTPNLSFTWKF
jgi:ferric enterobactin receptor